MDWMTFAGYALSVIETLALLGALVFMTRAKKADKHSPEKKTQMQRSVLFLLGFLVLTVLRRTFLGA